MPSRPNILLILSDQHSPHVLGCAGDPVVRTPNLDGLARDGLRFSNTYCTSPLCGPSRMSLLTSLPCTETGVLTNNCQLDSSLPTFANALNDQGYQTVLCGRMHFNGLDQHHGFSRRIMGDVFHGKPPPGAKHGIFGNVSPSNGQNAKCVTYAGPGTTCYQQFDQEVTDRTIRFLQSEHERPFAIVAGFILPHNPFICPKELFDYYYERVALPSVGDLTNIHPAVQVYREHRGYPSIDQQDARIARAAYYGLVELMDRNIGSLLNALRKSELERETLVIYTSDHGESAGENGLWTKSNFYEASVKVPMIWRLPGVITPDSVQHHVTSLLDIGTTMSSLAGAEKPFGRGRDLRHLLDSTDGGTVPGWRDEAVALMAGNLGDPPAGMLRAGHFKLNRYHGFERPQLFDLEADPHETIDLGNDPAYAGIRRRMEQRLSQEFDGNRILEELKAAEQVKPRWQGASSEMEWIVEYSSNKFNRNWLRCRMQD